MRPVPPMSVDGYVEITFAKNQPQYDPLPAIRSEDGQVVTEWELSDEELSRVNFSRRVRLKILTFNTALQPVKLEVV